MLQQAFGRTVEQKKSQQAEKWEAEKSQHSAARRGKWMKLKTFRDFPAVGGGSEISTWLIWYVKATVSNVASWKALLKRKASFLSAAGFPGFGEVTVDRQGYKK